MKYQLNAQLLSYKQMPEKLSRIPLIICYFLLSVCAIFPSQEECSRTRNLRCGMVYVCETVFSLKKMMGIIWNGELREWEHVKNENWELIIQVLELGASEEVTMRNSKIWSSWLQGIVHAICLWNYNSVGQGIEEKPVKGHYNNQNPFWVRRFPKPKLAGAESVTGKNHCVDDLS